MMSLSILTAVGIILKGLLLMSILYNGVQLITRLIMSLTSVQEIDDKFISGLALSVALYYIINHIV